MAPRSDGHGEAPRTAELIVATISQFETSMAHGDWAAANDLLPALLGHLRACELTQADVSREILELARTALNRANQHAEQVRSDIAAELRHITRGRKAVTAYA